MTQNDKKELVLSDANRSDIQTVVEYLWNDESRHYEESLPEERKNHIFKVLRRLRKLAAHPVRVLVQRA